MRRAAALLSLLALAACAHPPRELVPDAATAMATATRLCNWQPDAKLRAELQGDKWRVWNDAENAQAVLNRYDTSTTYVCVGL